MKPAQSNTKLTHSTRRIPSRQTCQPTPLTITVDDNSVTESDTDQQGNSSLESEPEDYHSAQHIENQLGLEEWEFQRLLGIPEVPEPAGESQLFEGTCPTLTPNIEKIDREVQASQNEPVGKDDIPVDDVKPGMFLSLTG